MCGLFFSCSGTGPLLANDETIRLLKRRGPDSCQIISQRVCIGTTSQEPGSSSAELYLTFASTVLSLRGTDIVEQPLVDKKSGSLFCWNGEAWKICSHAVGGNDAQAVFQLLLDCLQDCELDGFDQATQRKITLGLFEKCLGTIRGPFSFVFYDAVFKRVLYGRDVLGRRSLLRRTSADSITISSVCFPSTETPYEEVEPFGIFVLDLAAYKSLCSVGDVVAPQEKSSPLATCFVSRAIPLSTSEESFPPYYLSRIPTCSPFPSINRDMKRPNESMLRIDSPAVHELYCYLHDSIKLRAVNIPLPPTASDADARVGILFSGGLDCTLLARILHEILPISHPIDLLNAAFENPRLLANAAANPQQREDRHLKASSAYSLCPDRLTGLTSYKELIRVCTGRLWQFVAVDVPFVESKGHRSQIISLMHPHNTEMDLSIACALYFAARGSGTLHDSKGNKTSSYTTPARVLFSGLGADELFAGYMRHSTSFNRKGYIGLVDELELDFNRLGTRNLGRDDRVISHWGKEMRYPYLDESLISWALGLSVWEKCSFEDDEIAREVRPGLSLDPEKHLLRLLAWRLGLESAAMEKKRAIQFGARTARMHAESALVPAVYYQRQVQ